MDILINKICSNLTKIQQWHVITVNGFYRWLLSSTESNMRQEVEIMLPHSVAKICYWPIRSQEFCPDQ